MKTSENTASKIDWLSIFLVGGFSILLFLIIKILGITKVDSSAGWFVFNLAFLVNFPHFFMSYHLLYGDFRKSIFKKSRFFVAGVLAPLITAAVLIYAFAISKIDLLGYMVNAMYFFVGWHYIKQIFGVITVFNIKSKIFYTTLERRSLKALLYSLWYVSWISANTAKNTNVMEGIPFDTFALPTELKDFGLAVFGVLFLNCIYLGYKKYLREGLVISLEGFVALIALIIWFIPAFANPVFLLVIPFFHSLQYIVFVWMLKKNQANHLVPVRETPEQRNEYLKIFIGFLVLCALTGAFFMWLLPVTLDQSQMFKMANTAIKPFMFGITIFINIHHYFIDHAIWRKDNETIRKYLFS